MRAEGSQRNRTNSQILRKEGPKYLAGVLVPGACDVHYSFGVSHLARGQWRLLRRCISTICCPSPTMAGHVAGGGVAR